MNSNGVISLGNSVSLCTSGTFPLANFQELIAPYWADVDTRGTGIIWYRETTDPDLLERADNEIRQAFPTMRFESQLLFISTWDHVGYFDQKTDRVSNYFTTFYVTQLWKMNLNVIRLQFTVSPSNTPYTCLKIYCNSTGTVLLKNNINALAN